MLRKAFDQLTASFDKTKTLRNAERHVGQGKLRAAISEYKAVVENDPRDFGTMNMLGDLYAKNSEKKKAIECYATVAEHYQKQGFSQKAIAVYKKISKLEPTSAVVSAKLAELYQTKGSVSEARSHYTTLAEHYSQSGKVVEAIAIWKQIALLDPNDTEVYLNLAESYKQENQLDEAADAYAEAGLRLALTGRFEKATENFTCALAIVPTHYKALEGQIRVHDKLGKPHEAAEMLEALLARESYNCHLLALLIDCYLQAGDHAKAESNMIRMVEHEPANHPRFLDLACIYVNQGDLVSAVRVISFCIENLIASGKAADCRRWIDAILEKDAENIGGLRLRARCCSAERQKKELRATLELLAKVSRKAESVEDERHALSQLVIILPQETGHADRLRELNEEYGFEENPFDEAVIERQLDQEDPSNLIESNGFAAQSLDNTGTAAADVTDTAILLERNGLVSDNVADPLDAETIADDTGEAEVDLAAPVDGASLSRENAVEKELESIRFYVENGYSGLAQTALEDLRAEHGDRPEFDEIERSLGGGSAKVEQAIAESNIEIEIVSDNGNAAKSLELDDMRTALGFDEGEADDDSDFDTHYQLGVAYHEMGLIQESIKEFQDAINLVSPTDTKQRFFQCAILLGHCFMENKMAKLALKWFNRALESPNLSDEEKKAMWYEIALAHEADGDQESARRYFEQVYAEDVDFRDIGKRMTNVPTGA